jgi:hypothetical protein
MENPFGIIAVMPHALGCNKLPYRFKRRTAVVTRLADEVGGVRAVKIALEIVARSPDVLLDEARAKIL